MKSLLEEKIQNGPLLSVFLVAKTQTHTTHTLSTPAVAEYLPAGHDVQAAAAEEVDPTGPYVPAAHTEPEQVEAPITAEYLPAVQSVQTVEPVVRAQRQITSQIHMHMYICIEDVCVCVPIFM